MQKFVLLSLLLASPFATAQIDRKGNGGDMCELRIQSIRDDIAAWIIGSGSKGLKLPDGVSLEKYDNEMLRLIKTATISCVDEELKVGASQKTCMNFLDEAGKPRIHCQIKRFGDTTDSDQYVLIHHEYAGLAGFETNATESSRYPISSQIAGYLENQTTKRLVIRPAPPAPPSLRPCPDLSGEYRGTCLEQTLNGRRQVNYEMKISQNACESVTLGAHYFNETFPVGVPVDRGNDLNTSKVRTTVSYFKSALYISNVFGADLSDPSMRSVEAWEKKTVNGRDVLIGDYESVARPSVQVTMKCELQQVSAPSKPTTEFSGLWRGRGEMRPNPFPETPNPFEVTILFEEDGKTLKWMDRWKLKGGGFHTRVTEFAIRGNELFFKSSKVGSITAKTISLQYYSLTMQPDWKGPNNKFETQFVIDPDGKLDFRFKVTMPDGTTMTKTALGLRR